MTGQLNPEENRASAPLKSAVAEIIRRISEILPDLREPIKMYIAGGVAINFFYGLSRYRGPGRYLLAPNHFSKWQ